MTQGNPIFRSVEAAGFDTCDWIFRRCGVRVVVNWSGAQNRLVWFTAQHSSSVLRSTSSHFTGNEAFPKLTTNTTRHYAHIWDAENDNSTNNITNNCVPKSYTKHIKTVGNHWDHERRYVQCAKDGLAAPGARGTRWTHEAWLRQLRRCSEERVSGGWQIQIKHGPPKPLIWKKMVCTCVCSLLTPVFGLWFMCTVASGSHAWRLTTHIHADILDRRCALLLKLARASPKMSNVYQTIPHISPFWSILQQGGSLSHLTSCLWCSVKLWTYHSFPGPGFFVSRHVPGIWSPGSAGSSKSPAWASAWQEVLKDTGRSHERIRNEMKVIEHYASACRYL